MTSIPKARAPRTKGRVPTNLSLGKNTIAAVLLHCETARCSDQDESEASELSN